MSRKILSIDIRDNAIAAVVLNTGLTNITIEACAHLPLPAATEDTPPLQAVLKQLKDQLKDGVSGVAIGLPADRTFYRHLSVPFKDEKKIRQVLPFELEPSLPIAVDDLAIDFQKSADPEESILLTAATDKRQIETIKADLTALHLRPQLIVPGAFPLALGLTTYFEQLDHQALLLDVGTRKATLFVLDAKKIALIRTLVSDITTEAGVEALALNIRQTLTGFADSKPDGFTPTALYVSGKQFEDETASDRLSEALELPARVVDLKAAVPKLEIAGDLNTWQPCVYDGALAIGLIEAENRPCLNFHRTSSMFRNYWTTYRPYIRGPAALLIVLILLSLGGVLIDSHMLQKQVDGINAKMESVFAAAFPGTKRVPKIDVLQQMTSELKSAKSSGIDAEQGGPQVRTIDILQQLSQLIPKEIDVVFSRLVLASDGLTISGETAAFNVVDDVKSRLEKSTLFKQVTIASANMDKSGNKVVFKLKVDL